MVARMTAEEAKQELLTSVENETRREMAMMIRK